MITRRRKPGLKRYVTAFASAYAPTARRHQWLIVVRCPFCGSGHRHLSPNKPELSGVHRPGCRPGAAYWVVVARQYAGQEDDTPQGATAANGGATLW